MHPARAPRLEHLHEPLDRREQLVSDVRRGLGKRPKSLPSKYFYDERGSRLFERITRLPEYYQTDTEAAILEAHAERIIDAVRPSELVELGSGSSRKTRLLIEAMHDAGHGARYVAVDVSEAALRAAGEALRADHPWLEFHGVVGDFLADLAEIPRQGPGLVLFLGSTIGNMDAEQRNQLLEGVAGLLGNHDAFLLGLDLVKDADTLERAYDDSEGVTAEFNRNVLHVLNRELGADFPVEDFEHVAPWCPEESRIEMRLRARRPMRVRIPEADMSVTFEKGEEVRTEISCKFTRDSAAAELAAAGLHLEAWFTDERNLFAVALARRRA